MSNTCAKIGLILSIVSFILNPFSALPGIAFLVSLVGLIIGCVDSSKGGVGTAIVGMVLAPIAAGVQALGDTLITSLTLGFGAFVWLI